MPNIFFTEENFVLAFPLLAVCSIYVSKRDMSRREDNSIIVIVCLQPLHPHFYWLISAGVFQVHSSHDWAPYHRCYIYFDTSAGQIYCEWVSTLRTHIIGTSLVANILSSLSYCHCQAAVQMSTLIKQSFVILYQMKMPLLQSKRPRRKRNSGKLLRSWGESFLPKKWFPFHTIAHVNIAIIGRGLRRREKMLRIPTGRTPQMTILIQRWLQNLQRGRERLSKKGGDIPIPPASEPVYFWQKQHGQQCGKISSLVD